MRTRIGIAGVAIGALLLAACGDDTTADDPTAQERIAELEAELEESREDAAELLQENERLHEELRQLTDEPPDEDGEPTEDDPAEDEPTDDEVADGNGEPTAAAEPQPIRSPEGLNEQLRTLFDLGDGPDGGWDPGTTEWRSADPPPGLEAEYDEPGELALDLAEALEGASLGLDTWETTVRVLLDDDDPDLAYVAVLSWGFADDSVIGRDLRMTITHSDGVWSPGGAEERFHCMRGVAEEEQLCV